MFHLCIADDEPIIRQGLLSLPWSEIGARVIGDAADGMEALEILQTEQIDVLLADVRMPGVGGIELAKRLHESKANTQVVLLSGYGEFEYAQQAIEYGVAQYLLKPATPCEILAAVKQSGLQAVKLRADDEHLRQLEEELGRKRLEHSHGQIVLGSISHSDVAQQAIRYLVEGYASAISLNSMSEDLHFSTIYLSRVVKKATGYTFSELLSGFRVLEVATRLRETNEKFMKICEDVGHMDPRYFSQVFKRFYGVAPSAYRRSPIEPRDSELALTLVALRDLEGSDDLEPSG